MAGLNVIHIIDTKSTAFKSVQLFYNHQLLIIIYILCVRYTLFHTIIYYYCTLSIILISLYNTALKYIYHEQNMNLVSSKLIYVYPYPCILPLHMIFPDYSLFTYYNMEICVYLILLCEILNPYFENIIMNVFDYPLL